MKHLVYENDSNKFYVGSIEETEVKFLMDFKNLWKEPHYMNPLGGFTCFKYVMFKGKPYIRMDACNEIMSINSIMSFVASIAPDIESLPEQAYQKIDMSLAGAFGIESTPKPFLDRLIETLYRFKDYVQGDDCDICVNINTACKRDEGVMEKVEEVKNDIKRNFAAGVNNVTSYMATEESRMFIEVPPLPQLISYYLQNVAVLPSRDSVMPPYKDPIFAKGSYMSVSPTRADRLLIEGNAKNNYLPIQDNEKEYYNVLCNMIDSALNHGKESREYKAIMFYLNMLIERAAVFNWSHTCRVVVARSGVIEIDTDSDFDTDSADTDEEGGALFERDPNAMNLYDLRVEDSLTVIKDMTDYLIDVDPYAVAEFLIKMLRWGKRKPTKITFSCFQGDNAKSNACEFDLNSFSAATPSVDYLNSKPVSENGCEFYFVNGIKSGVPFADREYVTHLGLSGVHSNTFIGIETYRKYLAPSGATFIQHVYMSILDVVEILKKNPNMIQGITLNHDNSVTVTYPKDSGSPQTMRNVMDLVGNSKDGSKITYVSDHVTSLALSLNAKADSSSYLNVLEIFFRNPNTYSELKAGSFNTIDEAADKSQFMSYDQLLMYKVASELLPKVLKVFNKALVDATSIPKLDNILTMLMQECEDGNVEVSGSVVSAKAVSKLKQLDVMNREQETENALDLGEQIYKELEGPFILADVVDESGVAVFSMVRNATGHYKIYAKGNPEPENISQGKKSIVHLTKLYSKVAADFMRMGLTEKPTLIHHFDSRETFKSFYAMYLTHFGLKKKK